MHPFAVSLELKSVSTPPNTLALGSSPRENYTAHICLFVHTSTCLLIDFLLCVSASAVQSQIFDHKETLDTFASHCGTRERLRVSRLLHLRGVGVLHLLVDLRLLQLRTGTHRGRRAGGGARAEQGTLRNSFLV